MNYIGDALISKRRKKGCAGHVEDSVWSSSSSTVKRRRVGDVAEERVAEEEEEPKNGNNYFMVHRLAQDTDGGRMWRTNPEEEEVEKDEDQGEHFHQSADSTDRKK